MAARFAAAPRRARGCMQRARAERDHKQERPTRCRLVVGDATSGIGQARPSWFNEPAHTQGTGAQLRQPGRGLDSSDAEDQGDLSRSRHRHAGQIGVPSVPAEDVVEQARIAWSANARGGAVRATRPAEQAPAGSESGDDRRGPAASWSKDPAVDPVYRAGADGRDPGHRRYAVSVPNEEATLAICGSGGHHAIDE